MYALGTKVSSTTISLKNIFHGTSIYSEVITPCFSTVKRTFPFENGSLTRSRAVSQI
ncbi:MAG: hypothetical protein H6767_00630 [Candidatus Peribacteria bacterium]|nr:MAG: hypothetical protein H6767_00630 [Candidatus Peribacteria bacterium]